MLTKLRLFVKEYTNIILSGIGSIIVGFAFVSLIQWDRKDSTNPELFLWLSLCLAVLGIALWTIAVLLQ
jgi:hypothetical protein